MYYLHKITSILSTLYVSFMCFLKKTHTVVLYINGSHVDESGHALQHPNLHAAFTKASIKGTEALAESWGSVKSAFGDVKP